MKNILNKIWKGLVVAFKVITTHWILVFSFFLVLSLYISDNKTEAELSFILWFGALSMWFVFVLLTEKLLGYKTVGVYLYYNYKDFNTKEAGSGFRFTSIKVLKTSNINQALFTLQKEMIKEAKEDLEKEGKGNFLIDKIEIIK